MWEEVKEKNGKTPDAHAREETPKMRGGFSRALRPAHATRFTLCTTRPTSKEIYRQCLFGTKKNVTLSHERFDHRRQASLIPPPPAVSPVLVRGHGGRSANLRGRPLPSAVAATRFGFHRDEDPLSRCRCTCFLENQFVARSPVEVAEHKSGRPMRTTALK